MTDVDNMPGWEGYDGLEDAERWELDGPVVAGCEECGAQGDVQCEPGCPNLDFRDAELDAVIEP